MTSNIIYKAEILQADSTEKKFYVGMTAHPFKHHYNNHTKSFCNHKYSNKTVLSNYMWGLKDEGKDFTVNWSILKLTKGYESGAKLCNLCLEEKLFIMKAYKKNLLNKRSEIFSTCWHRNKFLINKMNTPCWRTRLYKRITKSGSGFLGFFPDNYGKFRCSKENKCIHQGNIEVLYDHKGIKLMLFVQAVE